MNILVSQISDLEARNRSLESRAHQRANGGSKELMAHLSEPQPVLQGPTDTSERVQVHVAGAASTSSRPQEVTVQVEVRAEGDVAELVTRVLAAIKETGRFTVAAVDARRPSDGVAQATFTLRATVTNTAPTLIFCRCIAYCICAKLNASNVFQEKMRWVKVGQTQTDQPPVAAFPNGDSAGPTTRTTGENSPAPCSGT